MAINWKGGGAGLLGGAGGGALAGSAFGPIGTGVGGGLGGLLGLLGGLFGGGNEGGPERMQFTPEEQSILQFLMQQGQGNIQNPYQGFAPIAQQAQSNFFGNTVPTLAERFTSMGQNNIASSPAFATNLGYAGAGLNEGLAALQSQYGQQNQNLGLQQLQMGLTPAFNQHYKASQPGFGENILSGAISAAPNALQAYTQNKALKALKG